MEWMIAIVGLVFLIIGLILFLNVGKDAGKNSVDELKKEFDKQVEILKEQCRIEAEDRDRFYDRQRRMDSELREREIEAINAGAESRFRELSMLMLKQGTESLGASNRNQMLEILRPLRENIESFRKAMEEASIEDKVARKSFHDRIEDLVRLNTSLSKDAENLASALRGNSKVQGDWGENILSTLLEKGGLSKGIHFSEQVTENSSGHALRDEKGKGLRPDVVVNLPDSRKLVIDSKVTLTAWVELSEAEDDRTRKTASEKLVRSVKKHIDELAEKRYQDFIGSTPDMVLMFIPVEGAFHAALESDREIAEYAWKRKVALTSPTHLFAIMHLVSNLWNVENRNNNTLLIADKAASLHDKIMLFMESFEALGKSIRTASETYDTALSRLAKGKGNIVKTTKEMEALGIKGRAGRTVPPKILDAYEAGGSTSPL